MHERDRGRLSVMLRGLLLGFLFASCTHSSPAPAVASPANASPTADTARCPPGTRRLVFQNRYWANPGKGDELFALRIHATDVQADMGIPRGRVFRGAGGDEPDAIWQLELAPQQEDQIMRAQSEHADLFRPVVEQMATLARRLESSVYCELRSREISPQGAQRER